MRYFGRQPPYGRDARESEGPMGTDLEQLAADLRTLLDIEAIKCLKYRYIRLVDEQRFEEWGKTCFTDDVFLSTLELGAHEGRDAVVAAVARGYRTAFTIHQVHMPEISITGKNTATGIWSLSDYTTFEYAGERHIEWGRGRYDEDYVRTPDGWRIRKSVFRRQAVPAPTRGVVVPEAR
jgi:hypothetical protein